MDKPKKKLKASYESRSTQSTDSSDLSSDPLKIRRNGKGKISNDPSSFMEPSRSSANIDTPNDRSIKKGKYRNPLSILEEAASSLYTESTSAYTGASESRINGKGVNRNQSSFTEEISSLINTGLSGSQNNVKGRKKPTRFAQGASSSVFTVTTDMKNKKGRYKESSSFVKKPKSSVYAANISGPSFQTASDLPSDTFTSDPSSGTTSTKVPHQSPPSKRVQLVPFKIKDVMEMIKDNPAYKDKTPVMIKMKENDIDEILEGRKVIRGKAEPLDEYLKQSNRESPVSLQRRLANENEELKRMCTGGGCSRFKLSKESTKSPRKSYDDTPNFAGADRTQEIFAMPDVQAFPVVRTQPVRRRRRRRASYHTPAPRRRVSRMKRPRSRTVVRPRRRARSRTVVRPRRRVVRIPHAPYVDPCTMYPMCNDDCAPVRAYRAPIINRPYRSRPRNYSRRRHQSRPRHYSRRRHHSRPRHYSKPRPIVSNYNTPYYAEPRAPGRVASRPYNTPYYALSTHRAVSPRSYNTPLTPSLRGIYYPENKEVTTVKSGWQIPRGKCCCNMCEGKLQFIQPGLCSKKKNIWTNEYAVIPKPQVNLIDPCEELDPSIYPRAENPCIRDGQGNPLTDCIGRPLRSPIGKRFLNFSGNGSVMDTSLRGNFWTGQPPLCVKCPMPSYSCGPDTTHNWWMSCGYPIKPNMNSFYKRVIAAEMGPC